MPFSLVKTPITCIECRFHKNEVYASYLNIHQLPLERINHGCLLDGAIVIKKAYYSEIWEVHM
jgi:hypothetical protein